MRLLGYLLAASIAFALMQAAAKLAALLAIIAALAAFISRPHESIGCVTGFVLLGIAGRFPLATMLLVTVLVILGWKADSRSPNSEGTQQRNSRLD